MSVIDEIAAERKRQIEVEGNTIEHDDSQHGPGDLARAAACYAIGSILPKRWRSMASGKEHESMMWPWDLSFWKPKDRRRDLIRAGALIVAEIDYLDRASSARLRSGTAPKGE